MSGEVTKSITAENTFSDEVKIQGYFNLSVSGIAGGTIVTVQRKSGVDGTNWQDVDTFDADKETYGFDPERFDYRVGVKTGEFGSGTCKVRLGCKWIDYLSS
jgi:hypothetical protein